MTCGYGAAIDDQHHGDAPAVPPRRGFGQTCAAFCTRGVRSVREARRALATPGTVVLALHAVADLRDDPLLSDYGIPRERFAELLDSLTRRGSTFVDLDQLLRMLDGQDAAPRHGVLVTFDDGYADLLTDALPVLRERGIPAVAFAVAGRVGGTNEWDRKVGARTLDLAGKDDLLTLAAQGIEIGSHGYSHCALATANREDLSHEIDDAADRLEALGLPRPRALAYPYGSWSEEVATEVSHGGYVAAFTCDYGVATESSARHALPRIVVRAGDTPLRLHLKILAARLPEPWRSRLFRLTGIRP